MQGWIPLIAAALVFLVLTGVTLWTLPKGKRRWVGVLGAIFLLGTPLNVAALMFAQAQNGGSPDIEKDGRYYTTTRGARTEVSEDVWRGLRWYQRVTLVATPLGLVAGFALLGRYLIAADDRQMEGRIREMMTRREGRDR